MATGYTPGELKASARKLLGKAVHRYKPVSKEGILERLFTMAFNGLVY